MVDPGGAWEYIVAVWNTKCCMLSAFTSSEGCFVACGAVLPECHVRCHRMLQKAYIPQGINRGALTPAVIIRGAHSTALNG